VTLQKGYTSKANVSPDYILGEVSQSSESQLSETTHPGVTVFSKRGHS